jgi:hypothetical protein
LFSDNNATAAALLPPEEKIFPEISVMSVCQRTLFKPRGEGARSFSRGAGEWAVRPTLFISIRLKRIGKNFF